MSSRSATGRIDWLGAVHQIVAVFSLKTAALTALLCGPLAAAAVFSTASNSIVLKDLDGHTQSFFAEKNTNPDPTVFIFVLPDCPVCNSYVPELKRLRQEFSQVEFFRVYADPDLTATEAKRHSKEYDFGFPGLLDPKQELIRKSGATRTPEAAVFSSDGKLLYRGRIDDRYVDFGKKRDQPGERDLENALSAILKNEPVHWPDKPPIGCFIPKKDN